MKMSRLLTLVLLSGFLLVGCGKPNEPESLKSQTTGGYSVVSKLATTAYAQDIVIKDNLAYIAQGEGGLVIVDISDAENPQTVSTTSYGVRGYCNKIEIKDTAVYLAAGSFGINVINVSDADTPFVSVSNLGMKPAKDFHIMGNYLFTAISEQGVGICEISYPTQPDIRVEFKTSGYARSMATTADSSKLLVACGEMGLSIYNITDFQEGYGEYPLAGWKDTPGYAEDVAVSGLESIAFLACGTAGLQIVDFSDTANIFIVGSLDDGGYAKEIIYNNNLVYMTTETYGLRIIDVTLVSDPKLVGSVGSEFALGVDMDDNYIYVADEDEGLIIIAKPD
ncbi:MAG: hypothetical protein HN704_15055 [Bacteroidetes bacterium]|jgi:hypothetical protein|nr:hypothetical protein [Bacteroidota bacterium]MBT6685822.1 hypothetical protein [Bacteroidota bacterium]MBT7143528.1 hypothetical protein [Bacteroidota bacterium]MBT7492916.1 hypothetical protein [Bacteroidota bacterium]